MALIHAHSLPPRHIQNENTSNTHAPPFPRSVKTTCLHPCSWSPALTAVHHHFNTLNHHYSPFIFNAQHVNDTHEPIKNVSIDSHTHAHAHPHTHAHFENLSKHIFNALNTNQKINTPNTVISLLSLFKSIHFPRLFGTAQAKQQFIYTNQCEKRLLTMIYGSRRKREERMKKNTHYDNLNTCSYAISPIHRC